MTPALPSGDPTSPRGAAAKEAATRIVEQVWSQLSVTLELAGHTFTWSGAAWHDVENPITRDRVLACITEAGGADEPEELRRALAELLVQGCEGPEHLRRSAVGMLVAGDDVRAGQVA